MGITLLAILSVVGCGDDRSPAPENDVKSEVVAVFGAITDKRIITLETVKDNTRQLVIKGFAMFGGGEIKSY